MFGIFLRYQKSAETYITLRFADLIHDNFDQCFLLSTEPNIVKAHSRWDSFLLEGGEQDMADWLQSCRHILWTSNAGIMDLAFANSFSAKSYFLMTSDKPRREQIYVCAQSDAVISPSWQLAQTIQERWGLKNVHHIPWDPGIPIVHHHPVNRSLKRKIIVPIPDRSSYGLNISSILYVVCKTLTFIPNCTASLLCLRSLPTKTTKRIKLFAEASGGRVTIERPSSWDDLQAIMSSGDLLAFTETDHDLSTGLLPLTALTMGLPVVAFDLPLIREYVFNNINGVLVPCRILVNDRRNSTEMDIVWFADAIIKLLSEPKLLIDLRLSIYEHLENRRRLLLQGWTNLLQKEI